jgi:hypothetical protein
MQVDLDVLGATSHVILLKATDFFADGSFDLFLESHRNPFIPMPVQAGIV